MKLKKRIKKKIGDTLEWWVLWRFPNPLENLYNTIKHLENFADEIHEWEFPGSRKFMQFPKASISFLNKILNHVIVPDESILFFWFSINSPHHKKKLSEINTSD